VDWCRVARGRRGRCTWPAERRRRAGKETEEGGREVDEGGLKSKILKTQGLHCNVQVTFKPEFK
jgi:hypothetical protein